MSKGSTVSKGSKPAAPNAPMGYVKDDELRFDTSQAPWMKIAEGERNKNIKEIIKDKSFYDGLRFQQACTDLSADLASFGSKSKLLGDPMSPDTDRFHLLAGRSLKRSPEHVIGQMEADQRERDNPEIVKYFEGLKTDPGYDAKHRSFALSPTDEVAGHGKVTAWCAAFVNWCLTQAGVPRLGFGTAASWLQFGTPLAVPVYGCLTIITPSDSTGSTTGHIAFYTETVGEWVKLLGGNQGHAINIVGFRKSTVVGYRWPTVINYYNLVDSDRPPVA